MEEGVFELNEAVDVWCSSCSRWSSLLGQPIEIVFRDIFKDIENDNLALISAKYEHVKSKLRNHGFVKLCYHQRLDDGRIIVLSYIHIMLC
jgi:hypothetical protein